MKEPVKHMIKRATKKQAKQKPTITTVYYQTSIQVAPYRHKHLGAYMSVPPGTTPEQTLKECAAWVHKTLGIPTKVPRDVPAIRALGDE